MARPVTGDGVLPKKLLSGFNLRPPIYELRTPVPHQRSETSPGRWLVSSVKSIVQNQPEAGCSLSEAFVSRPEGGP